MAELREVAPTILLSISGAIFILDVFGVGENFEMKSLGLAFFVSGFAMTL